MPYEGHNEAHNEARYGGRNEARYEGLDAGCDAGRKGSCNSKYTARRPKVRLLRRPFGCVVIRVVGIEIQGRQEMWHAEEGAGGPRCANCQM